MSSRRDELLAKKARLEELRRQRDLRRDSYGSPAQNLGEVSNLLESTILLALLNFLYRRLYRLSPSKNENWPSTRSCLTF